MTRSALESTLSFDGLWPPTRDVPNWLGRVEAVGFGLAAFTLRAILIGFYPALYGGDSIARMWRPGDLVLAYQLPMFQALLALAYGVADHPLAARLLSAATGALAAIAFYHLTQRLTGDRAAARVAAILFLVNPLFIVYSLVPYQESLMLALLAWAAAAYLAERRLLMSLALGLACLTRYESWVVAGSLFLLEAVVLVRDRATRSEAPRSSRPRLGPTLLRRAALFGWGPLVWLLWNGGALAPPGTYVLDTGWQWLRVGRLPYLLGRIAVYAPYALVLGPLGWWRLRSETRLCGSQPRRPCITFLIATVGAVVIAVVLLGHDYPPGTAGISERVAHVPLAAAILLSGLAIGALLRSRRARPWGRMALAGSVAVSLLLTVRQLEARVEAPRAATAARLAVLLEETTQVDERVLVAAKPMDRRLIDHYLELIQARKPEEKASARAMVKRLSAPLDYQRLVVSLPRGRERLVEAGEWEGERVHYVLVFEEARERTPPAVVPQGPPLASVRSPKPVDLYRAGAVSSR